MERAVSISAKDIGTISLASFLVVLEVFLMTALGAVLERTHILNNEFRSSLSRLTFFALMPCLIFSKTSKAISVDEIAHWWPILVAVVLYIAAGFVFGSVAAWILTVTGKMKKDNIALRRVFNATQMFSNTGSFPFAMMAAITTNIAPFDTEPGSTDRGVAYASVYVAIFMPILWTVGYSYMNVGAKNERISSVNLPLLSSDDDFDEPAIKPPPDNSWKAKLMRFTKSNQFKQVVNPTTFAALLAILVGLVPQIKKLFWSTNAPLRSISEAVEQMGNASVPITLLVLGGNLAHGPKMKSGVNWAVIIVSLLCRFVVMPLFGFAFVIGLQKLGLLIADPLFPMFLLLQSALPAAANLTIISQLQNNSATDILPTLVFFHYITCLVPITVMLTLSLTLFKG
eukprot:TRINITY_DN25635_c0_g1_i1.p1 TRINITY_DN25635_c0_g1~~TRINITY_DN25635_c0_g1_i1.p1  ORF type:complete len:425 (-),score=44.17 TRINITY_DN25635_c0_g1_i1:701-1897(-)